MASRARPRESGKAAGVTLRTERGNGSRRWLMTSQERQGRQGSPTTQEDLSGLGVMASQARQRHSAPDTVKDGCAPGTGAPRWDRGRGFQRARTRLLDDGVTPRLHQGSEAQVTDRVTEPPVTGPSRRVNTGDNWMARGKHKNVSDRNQRYWQRQSPVFRTLQTLDAPTHWKSKTQIDALIS